MHRQHNASSAIAFFLTIFLLVLPANAHKTEVSGNVAGTWHIEPNHSPKAGEPAQVWVALTQQGGAIVPLEQCDCQLTVYEGNTTNAAPILEPPLQAIAADNYQGIPGAEVIFPQIGQYQLKLTGRPRAGASFQPFELTYTVTVATGKSPATTTPTPQSQTTPQVHSPTSDSSGDTTSVIPNDALGKGLIGLGAIALIIGAVSIALRQRRATKR
ncbi:hypothetical protein ACQ4M4_25070 [Leptolyngbya sp. AN02str]|jgi:hypothetical protein|uniref:hypothetical protein n=1 Tax=Leptolyngbya sp. AN02str TaxID=3423363 RepID=UPI003D31F13F